MCPACIFGWEMESLGLVIGCRLEVVGCRLRCEDGIFLEGYEDG